MSPQLNTGLDKPVAFYEKVSSMGTWGGAKPWHVQTLHELEAATLPLEGVRLMPEAGGAFLHRPLSSATLLQDQIHRSRVHQGEA